MTKVQSGFQDHLALRYVPPAPSHIFLFFSNFCSILSSGNPHGNTSLPSCFASAAVVIPCLQLAAPLRIKSVINTHVAFERLLEMPISFPHWRFLALKLCRDRPT